MENCTRSNRLTHREIKEMSKNNMTNTILIHIFLPNEASKNHGKHFKTVSYNYQTFIPNALAIK